MSHVANYAANEFKAKKLAEILSKGHAIIDVSCTQTRLCKPGNDGDKVGWTVQTDGRMEDGLKSFYKLFVR